MIYILLQLLGAILILVYLLYSILAKMFLQAHFDRTVMAAEFLAHRGNTFAVDEHLTQFIVISLNPWFISIRISLAHFSNFSRPARIGAVRFFGGFKFAGRAFVGFWL